ncbi:hypothetical protein CPC08DRAFT_730070 [Agrocybe pediades]|nr:hypothetical protein CPC08DRAFT_730070 [Agrocybe pediades]
MTDNSNTQPPILSALALSQAIDALGRLGLTVVPSNGHNVPAAAASASIPTISVTSRSPWAGRVPRTMPVSSSAAQEAQQVLPANVSDDAGDTLGGFVVVSDDGMGMHQDALPDATSVATATAAPAPATVVADATVAPAPATVVDAATAAPAPATSQVSASGTAEHNGGQSGTLLCARCMNEIDKADAADAASANVASTEAADTDPLPAQGGSAEAAATDERWYCVFAGREVGVFDNWFYAQSLITGVSHSSYKRYSSKAKAEAAFEAAHMQGLVVVLT